MITLVLAATAALGMALLLNGLWAAAADRGALAVHAAAVPDALRSWMLRSGLDNVTPMQFLVASALVGIASGAVAAVLVGPGVIALSAAVAASLTPTLYWRRRRAEAAEAAAEAWPRIIEEIRVRVSSMGRPIPQALIEAGLHGPEELRFAFAAAQREWALTTDFARTTAVIKDRLADPTADAVCETLLVTHEIGGDLDTRLEALAEDRRINARDRAEAHSRQAGARVARWFVVIVPAGMALAGVSLGEGREAYSTAAGQLAAAVAVSLIVVCWWWAGRIMAVPREDRVFDR
jgi:tight adherence protein B